MRETGACRSPCDGTITLASFHLVLSICLFNKKMQPPGQKDLVSRRLPFERVLEPASGTYCRNLLSDHRDRVLRHSVEGGNRLGVRFKRTFRDDQVGELG